MRSVIVWWLVVGTVVLSLSVGTAAPSAGDESPPGGSRHAIYRGYSVEAVHIRNEVEERVVQGLQETLGLESWPGPAPGPTAGPEPGPSRAVLLLVPPALRSRLLSALLDARLTHYTHLEDVSRAFEEFDESLEQYRKSRGDRLLPFEDYPRHQQVNEYLESLAAAHPDRATLVTAGQSFLLRDIKYLKISTSNFTDASKPVIFLQSLIHAREWLTTPCVLFAAHRLLEGGEPLLELADWVLLPVVNPDGYEYSHTNIRLWRKTRSIDIDEPECLGVDGNRNYDAAFNTVGVSKYPCSDTWPGREPFSEPETSISRDIIREHARDGTNRMELFVDVHSHGSWVLFGMGDGSLPAGAPSLLAAGAAMAAAMDALKLPEGKLYTVGNSAKLLYKTSGSAHDFAQISGVPLSFTLELPNYGRDFRVPPEYIPHVTNETWAGFRAAAEVALVTYKARINATP